MRSVLFFVSIMAALYAILIIALIVLRPNIEATADVSTSMPEIENLSTNVQEVAIANPVTQSIALGNSSAISARDIDAIYLKAQEAAQNNEWDQAIKELERVQKLDATFESDNVSNSLVNAYLNAGKAKIAKRESGSNRFESAMSLFRRGAALAPENEQILLEIERLNTYLVGVRAIRLGSFQQAIDILRPLYELEPTYLTDQIGEDLYGVYLEIGDRAMRKDSPQVAVDYFNRAQNLAVADKSQVEARINSLETVKVSIAMAASPTAVPPTAVPPTAVPPTAVPPVFVPPTAIPPTPTFTPIPPPIAAPVAVATAAPRLALAKCPDLSTVITSPLDGETVSGYVAINGTAMQQEFKFYKIELAKSLSAKFSYLASEEIAVQNGELALWNSEQVPDGEYKLRVTVVQPDGNYPPPCDVNITVKNN